MMADNKMLIAKIKAAHDQSNQKWLYIKDMDIGDKRASLGLLIYGIDPFLDCFKIKINMKFQKCVKTTTQWDGRISLRLSALLT